MSLPKEYKDATLIIDADTILYKAATILQENFIQVRHKKNQTWTKNFRNVTEFYGRGKSRNGGWIEQQNLKRAEDNQISIDDFFIEPQAKITEELHIGFGRFKNDILNIIETSGLSKYKVVLGGKGNFRYELAQIQPYKANRPEKPLAYLDVREYAEKRFKKELVVVDGIEADDVVSSYAHQSYIHYKETGKWKYVLAYIDKDLNMCICPYINYNKLDEGIKKVTPFEAAKCFCVQMLTGDSTDNILGLPNFTLDITNKYNLRKTRGIGAATALAFFDGCKTIKDLFERVVEAYQSYYGVEEFDFKSFRGDESIRTWLDMLNENCQLLFMRREHDKEYDLKSALKNLGINYEQTNQERYYIAA